MRKYHMHFLTRSCVLLVAVLASTILASGQSLWRDRGGLIDDPTARAMGDVLTIVIQQRETINQDDRNRTQRNSEFTARVQSFNVKPDALPNPLPDVDLTSTHEFDARGLLQREGEFSATLSVVVIDVLPNGNMVFRGRQTTSIDGESKTIEMTGIVRRADVRADNTAPSTRVANAQVRYVSEGTLSRATTKGPVAEMLEWVWWAIWPF